MTKCKCKCKWDLGEFESALATRTQGTVGIVSIVVCEISRDHSFLKDHLFTDISYHKNTDSNLLESGI